MAKIKPSIPQGTRDFGPQVMRKRNYIMQTIRETFQVFGFQPLETPAMEQLDTLTGKYGDEGDQLMFKILNNGETLNKAATPIAASIQENTPLTRSVRLFSEKALRYDLTIPFARFVAMNQNELAMPFKRYQMQPVWRADKPQRGRYREFYQCDADVVGSNSLLNEIELLLIYDTVFEKLGLHGHELRVNNRKILSGLAEIAGRPDLLTDITVAIDKLDKIGIAKVKEELQQRGLGETEINVIENFLHIDGSNSEKLAQLSALLKNSPTGMKGIEEISFVLNAGLAKFSSTPILDVTLARGLNYYTGMIIEVKAPASVAIGSIGGGGRYDDLTGLFGLPGISGVGISFGVDRIYDVLEQLVLFPEAAQQSTKVLFLHLGEASIQTAFPLMMQLRRKGIPAELFHEASKMDKQLKYADKRSIPYIVILGDSELAENKVSIKNLNTREQQTVTLEDFELFAFE
ncbi:histidyl-tRNA synthetase [Chitinophaga costaii]|uniref:Histidine--tRNA ligase n=1 Tax=Chitinophaga costaii TaxID=1335309 RepID=A0A1C4BR31_9BACT|nr:histidine--tRNA ligase [Chitinophaga costaii]PUZ27513.1 histidine--tRNA ligase [Chitinophaga costaii]SCC09162.1 histidyl-tRNA synthetase [Chitinophaga costaii]